ncbi:hypothetical protein C2S53_002186 [Perilla frutescens var. hirtella]|uniref:Uncharacterized protein n=1 Tax=Perilla frutescens var. hirtella TaxID=608512 RepID=A0AAD4JLI3_PERFH|nr:hypothetical protein C2S53_002186 [Perilla frutescens var. hirtella]
MAKPSRYQAEFHDRYGIVIPYLQKFVFEDKEQFDYGPYYESDEDIYGVAEPHETILKYIKQIHDSFGFDVDCRAPSWFDGPFTPVNLAEAKHNMKKTYNDAMESAHFAIREINAETTSGKTYEFVELKKVVLTMNFLRLLTITVKEVDAGAVVRTIQAIVYYHFADGLELDQWRIKSDPKMLDACCCNLTFPFLPI